MRASAALVRVRMANPDSAHPAMGTTVPIVAGFEGCLLAKVVGRTAGMEQRGVQRVTEGLAAVTEVMAFGAEVWRTVRSFARDVGRLPVDDERALEIASAMPRYVPSDRQAERLLAILGRCREAGFEAVTVDAG